MIAHWRAQPQLQLADVKFAADPKANQLVKEDLVAFLLAASIDRGGQAFHLWNIPYRLKESWGHLDTQRIAAMDPVVLAADPAILQAPSQTSRAQLAKTIVSVARTIEQYGGDPSRLLEGTTDAVIARLQHIFGVGPGIARMIVIQRLLFFGHRPIPGGDLLPKLDVLVQRVFTRTGMVAECTDAQVAQALRGCSPNEIAIIDQVGWGIGHDYCSATEPRCGQCPLRSSCDQRGLPQA
jgi:hypothetical protein